MADRDDATDHGEIALGRVEHPGLPNLDAFERIDQLSHVDQRLAITLNLSGDMIDHFLRNLLDALRVGRGDSNDFFRFEHGYDRSSVRVRHIAVHGTRPSPDGREDLTP